MADDVLRRRRRVPRSDDDRAVSAWRTVARRRRYHHRRTRRTYPSSETPRTTTKLLSSSSPPPPRGNVLSGLAEAWAVPGVLDWSLSYFFIKTVTYTILFWMPYYLTLTLDSQATADNLTVLFDVSMIAGTTALGLVTDHRRRAFAALRALVRGRVAAAAVSAGTAPVHVPLRRGVRDRRLILGRARAHVRHGGERRSRRSGSGCGTTGARVESQRTRRRHRYPRCRARPDDRRARRERGRTRARSEAGSTNFGVPRRRPVRGERRARFRGNVTENAASGFTDATFDPPAGSYVVDRDDVSVFAAADLEWDAALPLYVETAEHHAGGVRKGLAALVSDFASGMGFLGNGVGDGDGGVANVNGGGVANVHGDGVASLGSSVSDGASGDEARVDGGFQTRWSRVFLMLFAFNLLAAGTLLRVAAWELRRTRGRETKEGASRP